MEFTNTYKKQHGQLANMVTSMESNLTEQTVIERTDAILEALARFSSLLNIHLAMEDNALYPLLHGSKSSEAESVAAKFEGEMGQLKEIVGNYLSQWEDPRSLKQQPKQFIKETRTLIAALKDRIRRENETLYPLADRLYENRGG